MDRIVIIGNSGSGKSFLAQRLCAPARLPVIDLDKLFAEGIDFSKMQALQLQEKWIVETVSSEFAASFLERATYLIWLDLPWLTCREGLQMRLEKPADFAQRLQWAEGYWERSGPCSYAGHQEFFDHFSGPKDRIVFWGCAEALYDD